jgi:hypothetical protein
LSGTFFLSGDVCAQFSFIFIDPFPLTLLLLQLHDADGRVYLDPPVCFFGQLAPGSVALLIVLNICLFLFLLAGEATMIFCAM